MKSPSFAVFLTAFVACGCAPMPSPEPPGSELAQALVTSPLCPISVHECAVGVDVTVSWDSLVQDDAGNTIPAPGAEAMAFLRNLNMDAQTALTVCHDVEGLFVGISSPVLFVEPVDGVQSATIQAAQLSGDGGADVLQLISHDCKPCNILILPSVASQVTELAL